MQISAGGYQIDYLAAILVISCALFLCFSTGGTSIFNTIVTGAQLLIILVVIIAGFTKADGANMTPFLPYGFRGIFDGAR